MARPRGEDGNRNVISEKLKKLRKSNSLSQRGLAEKLQLMGIDMDKNVITRIETQKRYVTDIEIRAIAKLFQVSYQYFLDEEENTK
mgnify:FL=1